MAQNLGQWWLESLEGGIFNCSGGDSGDHGGNTGHGNAAGSSDVAKDECMKKKRDEEAHAAQVDEEGESTLLLASAAVNELNFVPKRTPMHLDEGKNVCSTR
jgi:hypothetical protein